MEYAPQPMKTLSELEIFKVGPMMIKKSPRSVSNILCKRAYDTKECYKVAYENGAHPFMPSRQGAIVRKETNPWEAERDKAISTIIGLGNSEEAKKLLKKMTGYHRRSLVETTFSRLKKNFDLKLFSKALTIKRVNK